jgi:2-polyprenyl-6-methoxyphenol hydroxylase-like FAD-dependent oxidoreductase
VQPVDGHRGPVLVVGAGPVGLVLGCELARRHVPFRLIDMLPEPTDESRAILVHARSLEMMERIGAVEPLIASGIEARAMTFHAGREVLGRLELDTVDSPYPFSISTAQTETERVLTERLSELGASIERGVELVALEQDDDEVRATLRHPDGAEEVARSAWVVGTDGSHSTVRELLGAKLEGSFKGERFLLGDVEADYDLERASMHTFFAPDDGPLLVFPMRGDRLRLIPQLTDDSGDVEPTPEQLQAICDHRAGGIALRSAHWLTIFEIHHAQVPQYRHGRAFLAGDAAHVHSPAGGQGMNTGMQDAFNLGWKLALASAGKASTELLDSYQAERHPVAARVIEQSTILTNVGTVDHELARKLRNHAVHLAFGLAPIRHRLAAQTEETDISYRESPVVASTDRRHAGVRPGQAAPDVPGLDLHRVLARGPGHTALYVAPAGDAMPGAGSEPGRSVLVADAAPADSGFDEVVLDPERTVAARYGVDGDGAFLLVRPDGYVGLRAELGDQRAIADYLACLGIG